MDNNKRKYGRKSGRNAGRPETKMVELTVVCSDKVSPNKIPKNKSSLWSKLRKKNLIKKIKIFKTDNIYRKIREELNLNQEWKLYNAKEGKLIEVKDVNFKSVKSNVTKKNRRLYIGPATYDIVSSDDDASTNGVINRPSRSYVTSTPTAENVSNVNGLPTFTTEGNVNGLPTFTTEGHTNGLPVDNLDLNSSCSGADAELTDIDPSNPDISLSEPSYNYSINGGSINRNINGTSANVNELSDRLSLGTIEGVSYLILNINDSVNVSTHCNSIGSDNISDFINGSEGFGNLTSHIRTNDGFSTPTHGGFINCNINRFGNSDVNNHSSRDHTNELSDRLILRGVKHSLVQVDLSHVNNLPAYPGTLTIGGVSYLVLPETIPTNGFVNGSQLPVASMNEGVRNRSSSNDGFSTSTDGGFINRNINGNCANTSANRDINNQSSRDHTNELSDRLILRGVKYSLVQVDLSHANNLPTYTGTLMIYDVSYLVLPETIPTNGFVNGSTSGELPVACTDGGVSGSHISANEGFQSLDTSTFSINRDFNSFICEFSDGIPVNYYFTSQFSNSASDYITDSDHILIGNSYPFQNNSI